MRALGLLHSPLAVLALDDWEMPRYAPQTLTTKWKASFVRGNALGIMTSGLLQGQSSHEQEAGRGSLRDGVWRRGFL